MKFLFLEKLFSIKENLYKPTSALPLGLFRVFWGVVMVFHFYKLASKSGKVLYLDTVFHFKYPFFEWVKVLSPSGMMAVFYLGIIASLLMLLGFYYKTSAKFLFLLYAYVFFLDVSYWNNHYYAYLLINGFFVITDAHKAYSIDKKRLELDDYIPRWQLLLFQFQILIIYFYGGLSKLQNKDWMENVSGYSLLKNNLNWDKQYLYLTSLIITYGGLLYDLLLPFFLKWRKAIWWCFPFILLFNISNMIFFSIGTFPFAMIASFVLFIPAVHFTKFLKKKAKKTHYVTKTTAFQKQITLFFITTYVVFQLVFPFRSWFIKGNVFWTGEGKLFSWHMMSSSNRTYSNNFLLKEYDDNGNFTQETALNASKYLNYKQLKTLAALPTMLPQFANFIKKESELAGFKNVQVFGDIYQSKNYRANHKMVDPSIDLSNLEVHHYKHNPWILLYDSEKGYFKN